ncbi:MAG: hypothetical protein HY000_03245 [Planctomycetes bacterium]|nr:hypothetical protein [Planctomycetota bacterium]
MNSSPRLAPSSRLSPGALGDGVRQSRIAGGARLNGPPSLAGRAGDRIARPSAGNVNSFLGIRSPVVDRAGPSIARANLGGGINRSISVRPTWANVSANNVSAFHSRWQNAVVARPGLASPGVYNWPALYPHRTAYWAGWGAGVRPYWRQYHPGYHNWFGPIWWRNHPIARAAWHYANALVRPPYYWWRVPVWAAVNTWFRWAPGPVWTRPIYYDYGPGGNVTYTDNVVYIDGQQIGTADEFAASAAELATVPPPPSEEQAATAEWMPLGTFAISAHEKEANPTRVIQLAVNREGIVSGTLYNTATDQAYEVQGQVDKETQRVAFRIGESPDIVFETGLYNLTQDEAPTLVHFGLGHTATYLLVRLEQPEELPDEPLE